jgi:hypothetical protein
VVLFLFKRLACGYGGNNKTIVFVAKGEGGLDELKAQLPDNMPQYGYLRVSYVQPGDEVTQRTKFVFWAWGPEKTKPMLKGQMSVHQAAVKEVLKDWSLSIQASLPDEFTADIIQRKLEKSSY